MPNNLLYVKKALGRCTQTCPEFLDLDSYLDKELFISYQLVLGQVNKLITSDKLSKNVIKTISDNIDHIILSMLDIEAGKTVACIDRLGEIIVELEELLLEYEEYECLVNVRELNDFKNKTFNLKIK